MIAAAAVLWIASSASGQTEEQTFLARAISYGSGRNVCGRATFDHAKAAAGDFIYVTNEGNLLETGALRAADAVVVYHAEIGGPAAAALRGDAIPAVALSEGVWNTNGPRIEFDAPVYGAPQKISGDVFNAVVAHKTTRLIEGAVVCVDPALEIVALPSKNSAEAALSASQAARTFDGLRDVKIIERWFETATTPDLPAAVVREMVARAADGSMSATDFKELHEKAVKLGGAPVKTAEQEGFDRAQILAQFEIAGLEKSAEAATSRDALDRVARAAQATAARLQSTAKIIGTSAARTAADAARCAKIAAARRPKLPEHARGFDSVLAGVAARKPPANPLPADAWDRFLSENNLKSYLEEAVNDASLPLALKSERISERISSARLDARSAIGREILAALPKCSCLLSGPDGTASADDASGALEAVKSVWAQSWSRGPLGARMRAGLGARYAGPIEAAQAPKAEFSGVVFSRDPGTLRQGRILIEYASSTVEQFLSGRAATRQLTLNGSGQITQSIGSTENLLSPAQIERVFKLARALDADRAQGVEASFYFASDVLYATSFKVLEPPPAIRPVVDSSFAKPAASDLGIKSIGAPSKNL